MMFDALLVTKNVKKLMPTLNCWMVVYKYYCKVTFFCFVLCFIFSQVLCHYQTLKCNCNVRISQVVTFYCLTI